MKRFSIVPLVLMLQTGGCTDGVPTPGTVSEASYAGPSGSFRWPHGVIKFVADTSFLASSEAVTALNDAMNEITSFTGLTFEWQTDPSQATVVYELDPRYVAGGPCYGNSTTSRGDGLGWTVLIGCPNRPSVLHETGHAIGMSHEQKRPDAYSTNNLLCHAECIDQSLDGPTPCTTGPDFEADPGPATVYAPFDPLSFMAYNSYDISNSPAGVCPTLTLDDSGMCHGKQGDCIPEHIDFSVQDLNTLREVYEIALGTDDANDGFGYAIAAGDFDGDGYTDLAVGAPYKTVAGTKSGAIYLFKGTPSESTVTSAGVVSSNFSSALVAWKRITPDDLGITPHDGDDFGQALAAFDVDGDGTSDLVIGAPGSESGAGAVYVMTGHTWQQPTSWDSPLPPLHDGLEPAAPVGGVQQAFFDQAALGIGPGQAGDNLGAKLVRGDFDGDGLNDLAIGEPGRNAGQVVLLHHQAGALGYWKTLAPTSAASGARFGNALAAANWDGDGKEDLVIGAPQDGAGTVWVALSSQGTSANKVLTGATAGEEYGAALATGDFYGTGVSQLAVGIPHRAGSGRIAILQAVTSPSFAFTSKAVLDQTVAGETNQQGDRFGQVLLGVALQGASNNSLVVGMPSKLDAVAQSGMVQILHVGSSGWTGTVQHSPYRSPYSGQTSSQYGNSLAVGDFNGDHHRDLAVGAPTQPITGTTPSGAFWAWQGSSSGITLASECRYQSAEFVRD